MNNMALGRYRPYQTSIHKLDARVKIIGMISVIVAIFLNYGSTPLNFIVYGFLFLGLFIVMLLGKVSIRGVLKAFKAMWLMAVFILIFNIFTPMNQTGGYFDINGFKLYYAALYNTAYIFVRLFLMIMTTSILTTTTAPMEITFGLEFLMTPLKWIKIPVTAFAMILALALRFIPTLMEDTQRLMKAQASRGVDFKEGKFKEKINNSFFIEYVKYNNNYYGTSYSDLSKDKVVIIEAEGLKSYLEKARNQITVIFIRCSKPIRRIRMIERLDSEENIQKRLNSDDIVFNENVQAFADYVIDSSNSNVYDCAKLVDSLYKKSVNSDAN